MSQPMQLNSPLFPLEYFPTRLQRKVKTHIMGKGGAAAGGFDQKSGDAYIPLDNTAYYRNVRRHEALHGVYPPTSGTVDPTALGQGLEDMRIHVLGQSTINSQARRDELVTALRDLRIQKKHLSAIASSEPAKLRVNLIPVVRALAVLSFEHKRTSALTKMINQIVSTYEKALGKTGLLAAVSKAVEYLKVDNTAAARKCMMPYMTLPKGEKQPTPESGIGNSKQQQQQQNKNQKQKSDSKEYRAASPSVGEEENDEENDNDSDNDSDSDSESNNKKSEKEKEENEQSKNDTESEDGESDSDSDSEDGENEESDSENEESESEDGESDSDSNSDSDSDSESEDGESDSESDLDGESDSDSESGAGSDSESEDFEDVPCESTDDSFAAEKITLGGVGGSGKPSMSLEEALKKEVITPETVSVLSADVVSAMLEASSAGRSRGVPKMTIQKLPYTSSKRIKVGENDKPMMAGARIRAKRLCGAVSPNPGRMFARRGRRDGGTVLIDASGSMALSDERLQLLAERIPVGQVAYYSGGAYSGGNNLVIYSNGGRVYSLAKGERLPHRGNGNDIDFPAIQWLMKQPGPRYLVTDMGYCNSNNQIYDVAATLLTIRLVERKIVRLFPTLDHLEVELKLIDKISDTAKSYADRMKDYMEQCFKACRTCGGKGIDASDVARGHSYGETIYGGAYSKIKMCPTCSGTGTTDGTAYKLRY